MQSTRICTLLVSLTVTLTANLAYGNEVGQLNSFTMTISPVMEKAVNQLSSKTIDEITPHADALAEIVRENQLGSFFAKFSDLCHKYPKKPASSTETPTSESIRPKDEEKGQSPKSESMSQKDSEGEIRGNQENQDSAVEKDGQQSEAAKQPEEAKKSAGENESDDEGVAGTDGSKKKSPKTVNDLVEDKASKYRLNSAKAQVTLLKKNGNVEATVAKKGAQTTKKSFPLSNVGQLSLKEFVESLVK